MIKDHDLYKTFRELNGNPKWSIMAEPLWFIPYALFSPFQTLYMKELGISNVGIGFILSAGFLLQILFAIIGGVITDKLGRRYATVIFDTVSWTIPCLIWAFSQNFWWFLIASVINASYQITNTSWSCLFIEDCPPKHVTNAFTLIQLCGMLSVFVSPFAIYFVGKYGVVPVVRVMYFISSISMTLKFLLLFCFGGETKMGKQRLAETRNASILSMLAGYKKVFLSILKSKRMVFVVFFMAVSNIILISTTNFFSLYITEDLKISPGLVAVFPMIRTIIMWMFILGLQNAINRLKMRNSIIVGFIIYILSHIILILSPEKSLFMVILYTILEAFAYAIIIPRKEALMALFVDEEERSRILALYNALMIAITTPFGSIIGWLSEKNGVYPFVFNLLLFALGIWLTARSEDVKNIEIDIM